MLALYKRDEFIVQLDFFYGPGHAHMDAMWSVQIELVLCRIWSSVRKRHACTVRPRRTCMSNKMFPPFPSHDFVRWIYPEQDLDIWMNVDQSARIWAWWCMHAYHWQKQNLSTRNLHQLCTHTVHISGCTGTKHGCMHVYVSVCVAGCEFEIFDSRAAQIRTTHADASNMFDSRILYMLFSGFDWMVGSCLYLRWMKDFMTSRATDFIATDILPSSLPIRIQF